MSVGVQLEWHLLTDLNPETDFWDLSGILRFPTRSMHPIPRESAGERTRDPVGSHRRKPATKHLRKTRLTVKSSTVCHFASTSATNGGLRHRLVVGRRERGQRISFFSRSARNVLRSD